MTFRRTDESWCRITPGHVIFFHEKVLRPTGNCHASGPKPRPHLFTIILNTGITSSSPQSHLSLLGSFTSCTKVYSASLFRVGRRRAAPKFQSLSLSVRHPLTFITKSNNAPEKANSVKRRLALPHLRHRACAVLFDSSWLTRGRKCNWELNSL